MKINTLIYALGVSPLSLFAQIVILDHGAVGSAQVNLGFDYTQDFDTLTLPGGGNSPWVNNSTLSGWYSRTIDLGYQPRLGLYSAGPIGGEGDRALGASGGSGRDVVFAARFSNQSSSTVNSLSVAFDGEQWARIHNYPQQGPSALKFSYLIVPSGTYVMESAGVITDGWTYVPELYFTSLNHSSLTLELLDGNAPENRVENIHAWIAEIAVPPDYDIWLRWSSADLYPSEEGRNQHILAIDNLRVSFTAIPEPATVATLAGLLGLAGVIVRRRRPA